MGDVDAVVTWEALPQLMAEVRAMAHGLLAREGRGHSMQTTDLVLTALRRQRLASQDWGEVTWKGRRYFFGALYKAMERALKDHARKRAAKKRAMVTLVHLEEAQWHNLPETLKERPALVVALVEALERLANSRPQWAEVVQHRYYGGLTIDETALMMGVGEKTIRRWWDRARVLLHDDIIQILRDERRNDGAITNG